MTDLIFMNDVDVDIHDRFHLNLNAVADNASWGGMNRPIGGRH